MTLSMFALLGALAAAGGGPSVSQLSRELRRALAALDGKRAARVVSQLRQQGGRKALSVVISAAKKVPRDDELYWILIDGIASFSDPEAFEAMGDFIVRYRRTVMAEDILLALDRNTLSTKHLALLPVLAKCRGRLLLQAVRQLARIPIPQVVDALIAKLGKTSKSETELRTYLAGALASVTGRNFGANVALWKMYWEANRGKPLGQQRRRTSRTGTALDTLDTVRRARVIGLEKGPKRRIVVIKGKCVDGDRFDHNFDHIEHLLEQMQLPHTVITKEDFEQGFQLTESMVVCINCTMWREHCVCPTCKPGAYTGNRLHRCTGCTKHIIKTYDFSKAACNRLKGFVQAGGYLFTEDWVLEELLQKVYPEFLTAGPKLPDGNVKVVPGPGQAMHPYLEGVFHHDRETVLVPPKRAGGRTSPYGPGGQTSRYFTAGDYNWKIDLDSPAIVVRNARRVQVLLASPELSRLARGNGALAVTFQPAASRLSGKVLHILSHFGKQTSRNSEYGIQNLLLNFLIDANAHRGVALKKKARR